MSPLPALLLLCLLLRVEGSFPMMQERMMSPPSGMPSMPSGIPSADDLKKGAGEAVAKAKEIKKEADDEKLTEEQFYQCFTDINCYLGEKAHEDVFVCYGKVNETEKAEYARWFKDVPKGDFQEADLTFYGVNKKFCTLTREEQRENNDFFALIVADRLKDLCRKPENRGRCIRLKKASDCMTRLITEYVATGKCDTIIKEIPVPEGMPSMHLPSA